MIPHQISASYWLQLWKYGLIKLNVLSFGITFGHAYFWWPTPYKYGGYKSASMTKCRLGIKISVEIFRILWKNAFEKRILILPADGLHILK